MSRTLRRVIFAIGGAVALLVFLALAVQLFVDVDRHKPRLERAASDALGMDVRIDGGLRLGLLPGLRLTAEEVRVAGEDAVIVARVKRARLGIGLFPLLRGEFRLRRIELSQPGLTIERSAGGGLNVERLKRATTLLGSLDGASVSISDGSLLFVDRTSGDSLAATGIDLHVSRMRLTPPDGPGPMKIVSIKATLACREVRTRDLPVVSRVEASVDGKDGVLEFRPVTMDAFGGRLTGDVQADLSDSIPRGRIRCSLPRFRIEDFLEALSPTNAAEGTMDFSASLSVQGRTPGQWVQSAAGEVSLRGEGLTLVGSNLDRTLSRFESSQNFNLVDVGAVFFAGPLGLAVTKGYSFASLFRGAGGSSRIRTLVSDWTVERGVAQAKDVAMATSENRIALQGGLDLVNGRFVGVTVAVIDAKGCARMRQEIHGPFAKPVVEKPRVLTSLAGPVLKLYTRTRDLFPAAPCEVFYSGSVAPPG